MNRRERRAAKATEGSLQAFDPPEVYVKAIQKMHAFLVCWLAGRGTKPQFALPEKRVLLAVPIDRVPKLALDDAARELVGIFCEIAETISGGAPTALMLDSVLELAHVPVTRVTLDELGLDPKTYRIIPRGSGGSA